MGTRVLVREIAIVNPRGLHARAAARFVKLAETFAAELRVTKDDLTVGGTSILGLMMLAAGIGSTLTITAEGDDADEAMAAIAELIESGFGET